MDDFFVYGVILLTISSLLAVALYLGVEVAFNFMERKKRYSPEKIKEIQDEVLGILMEFNRNEVIPSVEACQKTCNEIKERLAKLEAGDEEAGDGGFIKSKRNKKIEPIYTSRHNLPQQDRY